MSYDGLKPDGKYSMVFEGHLIKYAEYEQMHVKATTRSMSMISTAKTSKNNSTVAGIAAGKTRSRSTAAAGTSASAAAKKAPCIPNPPTPIDTPRSLTELQKIGDPTTNASKMIQIAEMIST